MSHIHHIGYYWMLFYVWVVQGE